MRSESIQFTNSSGDHLAARLDQPDGHDPEAFVLFAHCFTCSKNLRAVGNISRALTDRGLAVLRFDFTGLGESEGDFADTNFSSNIADLVAAADYLATNYASPRILVGHSLGGAAVLQAAHRIDSVQAVATIGAPCDPKHVGHLLEDSRAEIEATGKARVTLAGRSFTIKKQFLDDLEETRMQEVIRSLNRALLIFHSPLDNTVGIDNAARIFQDAKHPKSFISLDQADHLLTDEADSRYVGTVLTAWARKYIDVSAYATAADAADAPPNDVDGVVARTGEGFRTEVAAGTHRFVADEPESIGGTDTGPTPYDLLSAALGACTSMTLRMYADRKGWPLDEASVHLKHDKIHASDCEHCETESGKIDRIERQIEVKGDLSEDQRQRLLEIANKCPVHRTLHSEIAVPTGLRD